MSVVIEFPPTEPPHPMSGALRAMNPLRQTVRSKLKNHRHKVGGVLDLIRIEAP